MIIQNHLRKHQILEVHTSNKNAQCLSFSNVSFNYNTRQLCIQLTTNKNAQCLSRYKPMQA